MRRRERLILVLGLAMGAAACGGDLDVDDRQEVQQEAGEARSLLAMSIAHQAITRTLPAGSGLLVHQLNALLPELNVVTVTVSPDAIEENLSEPLTGGEVPLRCPYLTKQEALTTVSCRFLVDQAVEEALVRSVEVTEEIEQQLRSEHAEALSAEEMDYVVGWVDQAIYSGIDVGAVHTIKRLRQDNVCDGEAAPSESAFALGQEQGWGLLERAEAEILPQVPKTNCDTKGIASSILGRAEEQRGQFLADHPLCADLAAENLGVVVDLAQAETDRAEGLDEGLRQAYEALRVRLVNTWECEPPPPPPSAQPSQPAQPGYPTQPGAPGQPAPEEGNTCVCVHRHNGEGQIQCVTEELAIAREGSAMGIIGRMPKYQDFFVPYESCTNQPHLWPVDSPLVLDLSGDGIALGTAQVPFDLSATGDRVKMPRLGADDPLLALDLDGDGAITSGAELFGNATGCGARCCADGIVALAQHDANGDGRVDGADPVYGRLRLWRDENGDGVSEPAELTSLADAGVQALGLASRHDLAFDRPGGYAIRALDFLRADGSTGVLHDVWFRVKLPAPPTSARTAGYTSSLFERARPQKSG